MAEIGEQRRTPVALEEVPEQLIQAFLAAEDDRFYRHPGIDWRGTLRGVWLYARSMGKGRVPGGSTITQQVARRFFLSTEYSVTRKLREIMLALKIEREMSKDEIFELYLNKEFLGHRAYGIGAAAQVYYGKRLDELTLAEAAMIAALPKAPSRNNPISGPQQAMIRRNWILGRMLMLGYIDQSQFDQAIVEPNNARYHGPVMELSAPWVAEMARREAVDLLGAEQAYGGGFHIVTTVDSRLQGLADRAVRNGLLAYDRRHGWRGAEQRIDPELLDTTDLVLAALADIRPVANLLPAAVLQVNEEAAELLLRNGDQATLAQDQVRWARPFLARDALGQRPERMDQVFEAGDVVRLVADDEYGWRLAQVPEAEAALVAMDASTGAIVALVGGLDFGRSQFNRVTQSRRQPGSAFKPFIYAAALDHGYTPASLVNDAPVVFDDPSMERAWRPTNFSRRFHGPTRLREAMVHSRNLVSVRLLMGMGMDYARDYIVDFGFDRSELPTGPSMALGSASITPLALTAAYAVFANGGHAVSPQFLYAIVDSAGRIVHEPEWTVICPDCPQPAEALPVALVDPDNGADDDSSNGSGPAVVRPRLAGEPEPEPTIEQIPPLPGPALPRIAPQVLSAQTTWLINSMLADVIRHGTGRRALALGRNDLAGKTGTTNDLRDTWFAGYGGGLVTTVWLGMDDHESLGRQEQGGRTALPIWVEFMDGALDEVPEQQLPAPVGLAQALINPESGLRARPGARGSVPEWFHADNLPPLEVATAGEDGTGEIPDPYDIF